MTIAGGRGKGPGDGGWTLGVGKASGDDEAGFGLAGPLLVVVSSTQEPVYAERQAHLNPPTNS